MTLDAFFQISVSIFCIITSVFMVVFFVWSILIRTRLNKLLRQIEEISEIAKNTAQDARAFTDRTIESIDAFKNSLFTLDSIRRVATNVISLIKNNTKGTENGQKK